MVDLSKVSKAVQEFVSNVAKQEGNKRQIDTRSEYDKLGAYLSGNQDGMNVHEKEFIQGFMIEYETKTKKEAEETEQTRIEEATTESTKESVKKIAKRLGDKKTIDTDEEAQALVLMLRNTKGDLNKADIEYIKNILRNSGFESYIEEDTQKEEKADSEPSTPPAEPVVEEEKADRKPSIPPAEPAVEEEKGDEKSKESAPVPARKKDTPVIPKVPKEPVEKPDAPANPKKPAIPASPAPDKPKTNTPHVTEGGRNKGLKLANAVISEIKSSYADNKKIKDALWAVNSVSAHTFIGQFANKRPGGLNQDVFSVSDLFDKLDYQDTLHVMKALLQQAKGMGLESNPAYKALQNEVEYGETAFSRGTETDPKPRTQQKADSAVNWLYNEMSRVMQKAGN